MTENRENETDPSSQEFLDCGMPKSTVWGIQDELHAMKEGIAELQDQLILETVISSELKSECSQTKLELETVSKTQCHQLKELEVFGLEMKDRTDKEHWLTDTLAIEWKKSQVLHCALETEESKSGRHKKRNKELKILSSCVLNFLSYKTFSIQISALPSLKGAMSIHSLGISLDGGLNIEDIFASEEGWNKEKLTLQQTLKRGEDKVYELKAEILHRIQSPDSD